VAVPDLESISAVRRDAQDAVARKVAVEAAIPRGISIAASVAWRLIVIAAGAVLVAYAAMQVLVIVIPFVVALLFTTALHPAARRLQRLGVPRTLSAILVVTLGLAFLAGLLALVVPTVADQATELSSQVEEGLRRLMRDAGGLVGLSDRQADRALDRATASLDSGSLASGLMSGALIVAEVLAAIILTIFLTFFLVRDGDKIWTWLVSLAGPDRRPTAHEAGVRAWAALTAYFRGVAFVALIDAVCIGAVLLMLDVPLAFPLIVLTFLAAFFPIIGAITAGAAAVLVALVSNGNTAALIVLVAIIVIQQVEGNILYPLVVGRSLNLHPVAMLLVLGVGGVVAGVAGAFLAVPVAAVVGAVINYARSAERHAILN
jgi:predicted PurR-regulated permease PerM